MEINEIPGIGWQWAIIVAIALATAYNLYCTVRKNMREEKKVQDAPLETNTNTIAEHARMLDADKRRLDAHEAMIADIKKGMMTQCYGIQALLEHELHNGNSDQMQEASDALNKWLRERP